MKNKAFTIPELLITIGLLALLASFCLPYTLNNICKNDVELKAIELKRALCYNRLQAIRTGNQRIFKNITFYPNGRCNNATFGIIEEKYVGIVKLNGFTGKVTYEILPRGQYDKRTMAIISYDLQTADN